MGTIYLLHFDPPYKHARHYTGYTINPTQRIAQCIGMTGQRLRLPAIGVAMAAVASFWTPIGHHGNLLIYGPGGYEFSDFLRVGVPPPRRHGLTACPATI